MSGTGCSGTPLIKKLGLKPGLPALVLNAPEQYPAWLGPGYGEAHWFCTPETPLAFIHVFVSERAELRHLLAGLLPRLRPEGMLWVSWPKKAAKLPTDLSEDAVRAEALPLGLVDVKVCAVSEIWSGLKLVIPKNLR